MWISLLGMAFLVFRAWLVEKKLADKLGEGRGYLSRTVNYVYCFAVIFEFKNLALNLILFYGAPVFVVIFFIWDVRFPKYFKRRTDWHDEKFWMYVERLTMHPPMIALGIWAYYKGMWDFNVEALKYHNVHSPTDWYIYMSVILSVLLSLGPYMLWDPRWYPRKKGWPVGLHIFIGASISVALHLVFFLTQYSRAFAGTLWP